MDPRVDNVFILNTIFGVIHFIYFMIYYGRCSTLNQKLNGIAKMEKAGVIEQSVLTASRESITNKIAKLKKIAFYPTIGVAVAHLTGLILQFNQTETVQLLVDGQLIQEHVSAIGTFPYVSYALITLGGFAFILAGNYVKGAQIFDPNKEFTRTGRYW